MIRERKLPDLSFANSYIYGFHKFVVIAAIHYKQIVTKILEKVPKG